MMKSRMPIGESVLQIKCHASTAVYRGPSDSAAQKPYEKAILSTTLSLTGPLIPVLPVQLWQVIAPDGGTQQPVASVGSA